MADQKIALEIELQAENAGKSLSQLKDEFKETQKQLDGLNPKSKEYLATLKKLGGLKDQMGDLKNEINAFAGADNKVKAFSGAINGVASGFQAATAASALFGSENEDLQKSLLKVQAAMSFANAISSLGGLTDAFRVLGNVIRANPILMIATIIIGIGTALYALKDKIDVVGKVFTWFGEKLKDIGEFLGFNIRETERYEAALASLDSQQKKVNKTIDQQIQLQKSLGKETYGLQKVQLQYNQKVLEDKIALHKKLNDLSAEDMQKLKDDLSQNLVDQQVLYNEYANKISETIKKQNDNYKKASDERKKILQDESDFRLKLQEDYERRSLEIQQEWEEKKKQQALLDAQDRANTANKTGEAVYKSTIDWEQRKNAVQLALMNDSFSALNSLADLLISNEKRREGVKKGIALFQIAVDTAQALSSAVVQAEKAAEFASSTVVGAPLAPLAAIASYASSAARIFGNAAKAKAILSKGSGGGGGGSAPRGGGAGAAAGGVPLLPVVQQNASTLINPDGTVNTGSGGREMQKVYVTETDITSTQNKINSIHRKAKIF